MAFTLLQKNLEEHNEHVLQTLKSLFKFSQGAAHVWDVHEIGLSKQERTLLEKLEECRHKHDNENQVINSSIVWDTCAFKMTVPSTRRDILAIYLNNLNSFSENKNWASEVVCGNTCLLNHLKDLDKKGNCNLMKETMKTHDTFETLSNPTSCLDVYLNLINNHKNTL